MDPSAGDRTAPEAALVSCIVPVFNCERYLRAALDSIFAQSYRHIEVIVVDDGSSDSTPEIIDSYVGRIVALRQENAGPATTRNRGIEVAAGDFIAFLDADDIWEPRKVELQMARFRARPELDVCVTNARNFWIDELAAERTRFEGHRITKELPAYLSSSLLARRRVFEIAGRFDQTLRFGDAAEWFTRVEAQGFLCERLPETLLLRRIHHTNRSRLLNQASRDEFLRVVKISLDRKRLLRRR
ncbi:MAG: glycosyltransferase family 2 protein [Deltaproteobacteria bacterium]|nr:glycosyltransferase family 2 protein [Deltaproteobacteria bacterium]